MADGATHRHYKGGLYRVLFEAVDCTNGREDVVVVVYEDMASRRRWIRDKAEFDGSLPDGRRRFAPL